jgi:hypothetical protein
MLTKMLPGIVGVVLFGLVFVSFSQAQELPENEVVYAYDDLGRVAHAIYIDRVAGLGKTIG